METQPRTEREPLGGKKKKHNNNKIPLRGPETVIYWGGQREAGLGDAMPRALIYDVIGTLTSVTSPGRSPISLPGQVLRYFRTV